MRKRNRPIYNGIQFDSDGELETYLYFKELNIPFTYQPESIELIPPYYESVTSVSKTGKVTTKNKTVLRPMSYTADFVVSVDNMPSDIINVMGFRASEDNNIYIDVKGSTMKNGKVKFVQNPDSVKFSIIQKIAYYVKKVFINKLSVVELFTKTFCPEKCRLTKTGKPKKAYINCKTLEEFKKEK